MSTWDMKQIKQVLHNTGAEFAGAHVNADEVLDVVLRKFNALDDGAAAAGGSVHPLTYRLLVEIERQDNKHGPFEGTILGRSRLAIACLEDEIAEARKAWRSERKALSWDATREEVLQVAAVAMRTLRDAL